MKYKAVLFDMDGTVMDSLTDMWNSVNISLSRFSMPALTQEQIKQYVGNGARRLIELSVPEGTDAETTEAVLNFYLPHYAAHCTENTRPYDGITELMETLRDAGLRQVIVSNKPDEATTEIAEKFFGGLAEFAVGEKQGTRRKPWPDMVNAAVERLGLSKEECVYVGDSEVDLATARNAGLNCISVLWGFRSRSTLEQAGAVCFAENVDQLRDILLRG